MSFTKCWTSPHPWSWSTEPCSHQIPPNQCRWLGRTLDGLSLRCFLLSMCQKGWATYHILFHSVVNNRPNNSTSSHLREFELVNVWFFVFKKWLKRWISYHTDGILISESTSHCSSGLVWLCCHKYVVKLYPTCGISVSTQGLKTFCYAVISWEMFHSEIYGISLYFYRRSWAQLASDWLVRSSFRNWSYRVTLML